MSFATFKAKPISSKVVLIEFGMSKLYTFFLNEEPGIWRIDWSVFVEAGDYGFETGAFCYGPFGQGGTADLTNEIPPGKVLSVNVGTDDYTSVSNLTNLRATNKSFWWDGEVLHIHFDGFKPPWVFSTIRLGLAVRYADKAGVYNGEYYDARLKSVSNLSIKADPLYYQILGYEGLTAELLNADGFFDALGAVDVFGQVFNVLYGEEGSSYSDFAVMFSGLIERFSVGTDSLRMFVSDKRKKFRRSIPTGIFDSTTYPYLKAENINKPIPLVYGYCDNVPVICTNETQSSPASYSFKIADTTFHPIKALTTVRVGGAAVTPASTTLSTATFTLSTANYKPGETVTVDVQGYESGGTLIQNALDVIKDLLANHADIAYTSDQYDTTEWAAAAALAPNINLVVRNLEGVEATIERICVSLNAIMFVKGNGKFTLRYMHAAKSIDETIGRDELFEELTEEHGGEDYLSSVLVHYDKNHDRGEYLKLLDVSQETDFEAAYGMIRRYEVETVLNDSSSAQVLATNLLDQYAGVGRWVKVSTNIAHIQLELVDDVTVDMDRENRARGGNVDFRVHGIIKDVMNGRVELMLRRL